MFTEISLLNNYWKIIEYNERSCLLSSQKNDITPTLARLLLTRNVASQFVDDYLYPDIKKNLPDPFLLKDMEKATDRLFLAIKNNEKIGIISDYDVDGSTSAAILYKFLDNFDNEIIIETPKRLSEGYGPNVRIMNEMVDKGITLIFTLDCGTSSFGIIDNKNYFETDVIVIDHHISEAILPKVHSIINPNRFDENSDYNQMAAVGVTFLFLMGIRKKMRENKYFEKKYNEPNLLCLLDLVALGTVCDVVNLSNHNRIFVKMGLDLIKKRKNLGISKIIDNSNISKTPTSGDLGFIIGPQLNAASRIDDSSLASKILISDNISEIEIISKKLILFNEKRKLIENSVFDEAILQAEKQENQKYTIVYGDNWHNGVLGIVASRLINRYFKPTIVISFTNKIGIGSARSIKDIDLGDIILNAKNQNILKGGGGHKMAAGLQIDFDKLLPFTQFLQSNLDSIPDNIFKKIDYYDAEISSNEINFDLLNMIEKIEPFGAGNPEPRFIIRDLKIEKVKILKEKHLLIFSRNEFSNNIKGICFNCINTVLGDYLLNFQNNKLAIGCTIHRDDFSKVEEPQLIIKDAMIIN